MQIAILGRQPAISLAELESLFGPKSLTPLGAEAALIDTPDPLPQSRLGGTLKSAKLLIRLEKTNLVGTFEYLAKTIPEHLQYLPEGKLQLGVSCYGYDIKAPWLLKQMLVLKKTIKATGRSVRIIENKAPALESAQVLYNKLTGELGWEFLLIKDGVDTVLAQTTGVQNVDDYSKRDFGRPKRDAFVGMLPPKLAQVMINLAGKHVIPEGATQNNSIKTHQARLLDPFCGTGVVLQEAILMGYQVYGTDVDARMVEYSQTNLDWLIGKYEKQSTKYELEAADAINHTWHQPIDLLVSEVYLGKPLTQLPDKLSLTDITRESNDIAEKFLKNIGQQVKKGTRVCLALPAWHLGDGRFEHLPLLDRLTDLGYNRLDLKHASFDQLVYHRPDQIVARELTVLEKN